MAVWMMRCRIFLQKLTGHISEVSIQSKLNFDLLWFLYGPKMCANFQRNLRGVDFFCWFGMEWPINDLTEDSFLQDFHRFVSHRPIPVTMILDNASNYLAAANKIEQLINSSAV